MNKKAKENILYGIGILFLIVCYFGIFYMALRPQFKVGELQTEIAILKMQIQKQELQKIKAQGE